MRSFSSKYKIKSLLAEGGMAQVYLASYETEGVLKPVVLKQILRGYQNQAVWKRAFFQEAKVMTLLHHSNIVEVYDFGKVGGVDTLAMEYVEGGTLLDVMREALDIPQDIALYMGCEILKGLRYAHQKGVIHCDLSPSNILISKWGEIKISDFGVSKLACQVLDSMSFGQGSKVHGKSRYLAPEVKSGQAHSVISDLYALGVILQDMVLDGKRDAEVSACNAAICRAISENPIQRFQTAAQFEAELINILKEKYPRMNYLRFENFLKTLPTFRPRKTTFLKTAFDFKPASASFSLKSFRARLRWALSLGCIAVLMTASQLQPVGYVRFNTEPWSEVFINGLYYGQTPILHAKLPIGRYTVLFQNKKLGLQTQKSVFIHPNEISNLIVKFTK